MIYKELQRRESEGNPIRVGASAIEWMGSGFVTAMSHMTGMELSLLANSNLNEALDAFLSTGLPREMIVETHSPGIATDAINSGKRVITSDITLAAKVPPIDIVTDSTWSPAIGAEVANACIQHGKDVVLVNIEADVTVGHILKKKAREAGVLYSVSSGDEPGCLMEPAMNRVA
jgi:predicted homoserine dehydrogenase-like protein